MVEVSICWVYNILVQTYRGLFVLIFLSFKDVVIVRQNYNFRQFNGEPLYEVWVRSNENILRFSNHEVLENILL